MTALNRDVLTRGAGDVPQEAPPRRLVVAYDIGSNRRRSAVADALKGFGVRVQFSVFECCVTATEWRRLESRLCVLLKPGADLLQVFTCGLGAPFDAYRDRPQDHWVV